MLIEILRQSWDALKRQPFRSFLTMLGIVWGIVAVTILIAYGNSGGIAVSIQRSAVSNQRSAFSALFLSGLNSEGLP